MTDRSADKKERHHYCDTKEGSSKTDDEQEENVEQKEMARSQLEPKAGAERKKLFLRLQGMIRERRRGVLSVC